MTNRALRFRRSRLGTARSVTLFARPGETLTVRAGQDYGQAGEEQGQATERAPCTVLIVADGDALIHPSMHVTPGSARCNFGQTDSATLGFLRCTSVHALICL